MSDRVRALGLCVFGVGLVIFAWYSALELHRVFLKAAFVGPLLAAVGAARMWPGAERQGLHVKIGAALGFLLGAASLLYLARLS